MAICQYRFLHNGRELILVADQYSRNPFIRCLYSTTSAAVIKQMKRLFVERSVPEVVYGGNRPQYTSKKFASFSVNFNFKHTPTIITIGQMVSQRGWLVYAKSYFWNRRKLTVTVTWQWCHTLQRQFQPISNLQLNSMECLFNTTSFKATDWR